MRRFFWNVKDAFFGNNYLLGQKLIIPMIIQVLYAPVLIATPLYATHYFLTCIKY